MTNGNWTNTFLNLFVLHVGKLYLWADGNNFNSINKGEARISQD